jgi:hypothetical protein
MGSKGKGKGKGKKKGKSKGKSKGKGVSSAAAIEEGPPRDPATREAEGAAAAEAEQQGQEEEEEEEEERKECAICLQDLQLEDDEEPWGDDEGEGSEALVVLKCGHRFHEICGDMWCAKCADKGWDVTCPNCRAPYVLLEK